ncbi:hypothetical protein COCOBI_03-8480 [Coccomyxa sp. Obi]|nr:hypothetical protein COCOBI_03-8480 [Coccomyxa sp. Obi]
MAVLRQSSGGLNGIIRDAAYRGKSRSTVRCFAAAGSRRATAVGRGFDNIKKIGQFIFIRHGEKTVDDNQTGLSTQGFIRATNLDKVFGRGNTAPGTYNTPDIIYAMKQKKVSSSRRPFDTVAPLAIKLGMDPVMGDRTGHHGDGVFDAQITRDDHDKLRDNIVEHAEDSYKGKTILICWEHKAIPQIVHTLGLTDTELNWGSNPFSGEDERTNYTAIWVFTPALVDDPRSFFRVYKMFDIVPNLCNAEGKCPEDDDPAVANAAYAINPAKGPYNTLAS